MEKPSKNEFSFTVVTDLNGNVLRVLTPSHQYSDIDVGIKKTIVEIKVIKFFQKYRQFIPIQRV